MIRVVVVLLIACIGLSSALALQKSRSRVALQDAAILQLNNNAKEMSETIRLEREWSQNRELVINRLGQIQKQIQVMQAQINSQTLENRKAVKELIANDKAVRTYMAMPVPPALGMLYKRDATTDPSQYRSSGAVQSDSVPATSTQPVKK